MEVEMLTVGPVAENTFIFHKEGADKALIVDPGDEAPRLLKALDDRGVQLEAILLTHTHLDHVGALAPVANATGAPVWCPELEAGVIADINSHLWPGFGPLEDYEADHLLQGGETLELAGFDINVIHTPGHSAGHLTYSIPDETAMFSGDVLFEGSIGRVDLPGGDPTGRTLLESIGTLIETHPAETTVYPGHMGVTTLGAEQQTNPFLRAFAK